MDNITHSLLGAAVGEAFFQGAKSKGAATKSSRFSFYMVSILANNFPDLDLLYRFIDPSNLGYLLHHRGHTHTLIWLWPQLIIMILIFWLYLKFKRHQTNSKEKWWLFITAATGLHLHIGMDFFNSYGVHPFHPFNNNWFYGDRIFIIEPLLWAFIVPLLYASTKSWWKHLVLLPCLALILFGIYMEALSILSLALTATSALIASVAMLKISAFKRPFACLGFVVLVISSFWVYGSLAYNKVIFETKGSQFGKIHDVILSPMPANPFCWTLIFIDGDEKHYRLHRGALNFLPKVADCPALSRMTPKELHRDPVEFENTVYIEWVGLYKTTYSALLEEIDQNCQLKAWFQFARSPIREGLLYNDVRFPGSEGGFASLNTKTENGKRCPPYPAPWRPPFEYEKLLNQAP